jgi:hypothetical protein
MSRVPGYLAIPGRGIDPGIMSRSMTLIPSFLIVGLARLRLDPSIHHPPVPVVWDALACLPAAVPSFPRRLDGVISLATVLPLIVRCQVADRIELTLSSLPSTSYGTK